MTERIESLRNAAGRTFVERDLLGSPDLLRLYIIRSTPRCIRAIYNLRGIWEEHLRGHYNLEAVDISQHPEIAESQQIVAAQTLIGAEPEPVLRFISDLSDTSRIVAGLDLRSEAEVVPTLGRH